MPDIQLRFHKDMLVLSGPINAALHARGFDADQEREMLVATEPETILEPLRLEMLTGAQCLVLPTAGITRARLAHVRAEDRAEVIADAALDLASELTPQHVLVEIGPTGLPLDVTSKTSLIANRDQYASAARLFEQAPIDALFLNDFTNVDDLRCALMGVRKVWDGPLFASVVVDEQGNLAGANQNIDHALVVMAEYGASVAGIALSAGPEQIAALVARMASVCNLPILVQLQVDEVYARDPHNNAPYWCADLAMQAVMPLRAAGVQFLRATGNAVASYTGALVAASAGLDSVR